MDRRPSPKQSLSAARLRAFTLEDQEKYAGQHVACSWDGSQILMSAPTLEELDAKLEQAGIAIGDVVHDYVDLPETSYVS